MSKNLFITGTGTDVGKTYVSALIVKKLLEDNQKAAYYKAAMSGNIRNSKGELIPVDAVHVKKTSNISQKIEDMCPYIYESPFAPHLSAKYEGNPVDMEVVKKQFKSLEKQYDYITMEGSGGIICPIRMDHIKINLEDIISTLNLSCILVADAGLGTINNVVLTTEYMKSKKIPIKGIILNNFDKSNILHGNNLFMCEHITQLKVLACVETNCKDIDIDVNLLKSLYD